MSPEELAQRADDAYQAVRALNHATLAAVMPAPMVYDLLGSLRPVGSALDQLARQLGVGLSRSLNLYDVYDNDREPDASVAMAIDALQRAAMHADRLGLALAAAQVAISQQGYHPTGTDETDETDKSGSLS